ncbi:hypothetical protein EXN66_Car002543 [Channa argus]|uniref:Uncharacterized protein n=1 Tax=Channa argus TaxID=215402 RepID=A0A6G1P9A3_CHAAH|nr:hypothetical protein EXN66_Car002543 [Channa argus]
MREMEKKTPTLVLASVGLIHKTEIFSGRMTVGISGFQIKAVSYCNDIFHAKPAQLWCFVFVRR